MDWYNITYQCRRCRSYLRSWGWGGLLEAMVRNDGCVSGGEVASGEVGSSGGRCCHRIGIVGGREKTQPYGIVCTAELGGRRTLVEEEAKR